MDKNKKIYYGNVGIHTYMRDLLSHPPEGYEFVINSGEKKNAFLGKIKGMGIIKWMYKNIIKKTFMQKSLMNKFVYTPSPENIDLILSAGTLIRERKPWVLLILDNPYSLAGNDYSLFIKNKENIERELASDYCKKIIIHTEACRKLMERFFSRKVLKKIKLVNPGISKKPYLSKKGDKNSVDFLFIGSINNPDDFYMKGGLETLEVFKRLSEKYGNIKLKVRSKIPEELKNKYSIKNIEFFERNLSLEELENLYKSSDVMILPGYNYFVMAYLESFSYGIPILTIDSYGVSDFIINSKNGFYVDLPRHVPFNEKYPGNMKTREFIESMKHFDEKVVENLYNRAELLIKDKRLMSKMRKDTLQVFKSKYSIDKQTKELKKIFDEATKNDQK